MKVRPAEVSDAERIAAIQNQIIRDTTVSFNSQEKTPAEVRDTISELPCFLVAEMEGEVIGFVSYMQFRRGVGYARAMEHSIVLGPEARRKGAGRALMTAAEDHARAAGVGSLWAGVSGENPDGMQFHSRLGFEEIARLPKVGYKFGRWLDLVLMRKWLLGSDD
jgi:phosphinothricin acetyltransferase